MAAEQIEIVVIAGPDKGRRFTLKRGETLIIGRGAQSDTQINDPRMSRVHCHACFDGERLILVDARSSSGTLVDGQRIVTRQLAPGATFQTGDSQFQMQGQAALGDHGQLKDLVGETLTHYHLQTIIHRGASGMVFRGFDVHHQRPVAVKVLDPLIAASDQQRERFVRAAQTMIDIRRGLDRALPTEKPIEAA